MEDSIVSVKIKEEKLDPEVERKLNPNILLPDSTIPIEGEAQVDEKKNIEPIKSSNEILAELFKVFNATPPEELLSNEKLSKKAKREHEKSKHKKAKKKKKKAQKSDATDNESNASEASKHKRKKHKHKHKKSKEKPVDKDEKPSIKERTVIMAADSSSSLKGKHIHSVKEEPVENSEPKHEKPSNKGESRKKKEKIRRSGSRVEEISDISLSDEETYLRERDRYKESITTDSSKRTNYDRYRNVFYRGSGSYYSGDRQERNFNRHHRSRSRSRSHTREHTRSRSKTRSRSPSKGLGIDKKRLLEIARKNAISMFKSGSLPGCAGMSEEVKDKVLLKMRYGGKTVQDLTNFCKKLSKGENYDDLSEFSSEEDSDVDKQGNAKAFHHPFVLKDREPIVMHIKNATPIPPKSADQKKAITMQFPVSSGQQHRLTEGWVPVPAKDAEPFLSTAIASKIVPAKPVGVPKNVFQKQLPIEEQQPAFKPVGPNGLPLNLDTAAIPLPDAAPIPIAVPPPTIAPPPVVPVPPVIEPPPTPMVFPTAPPPIDVSTIISQRLSAMRRLQENPMDCEAIKMMYTSQKEMTTWASSKHMPGQFTGSTGANILSARELTSGGQAWARRDQLTATVPVSGGMGMHLLKKMGWKPGEGLGREKTGSLQPLLLDVKLDKRGLVADEEVNGGRPQKPGPGPLAKRKKNTPAQVIAKQSMDNKHPVCLLNELSTKRKWTPPMYDLVTDEGPSHNKFFVFSVNVNGQIFNPGAGGNTKKEAKLVTARFCLQQMGIIP